MALIVHGQCGKTWSGARREHCAGCHETFNSAKAGDKHRRSGKCLDPVQAGLYPVEHSWGTSWQTSPPGTGFIPGEGRHG